MIENPPREETALLKEDWAGGKGLLIAEGCNKNRGYKMTSAAHG